MSREGPRLRRTDTVSAASRWVVFDLGEVLSAAPDHLASLSRMLGVDEAAGSAAYWRHRDAYDAGQEAHAYWDAVGSAVGVKVDKALARRLTDADAEGWLRLHPASLTLLRDVREAGYRLGLLSNLPHALARRVERETWAAMFDVLTFSCDAGVAKPEPAIYAWFTQNMPAGQGPPARVAFFDDRQVNVDGGAAMGWHAHLWGGHDDARAYLASIGMPT
jgi:putative hydrolase of the HAD superfamily